MFAKRATTATITAAATAVGVGVGLLAPAAYAAPPVRPAASPARTTPATFVGTPGLLTVSTGDNVLHFAGGGTSAPMPSKKVNDAEWAPDGSRVAYVDENGDLISVRSDATDKIVVAQGLGTGAHPTWMNGGSFIVYVQGGRLMKVPSLGGAPVVISAGSKAGDVDAAPQGGAHGLLVFQRTDASNKTWIWVYDGYADKATDTNKLGTVPSISPDGSTIAFINIDGQGVNQVWTSTPNGSNLTQMTNEPIGPQSDNNPVWSPDGTQLAFSTSTTVVTMPATKNALETMAVAVTGRISWQAVPSAGNLVERLDGLDRIATAVQASTWTWANNGTVTTPPIAGYPTTIAHRQANVAVIARQDLFADALSGSALAAREGGPLLLTQTSGLDPRTLTEMQRILAPGSFVYVLGQQAAISVKTEAQIDAAGFRVIRVGGVDRFETSVDIAETIVPTYTTDPVTILAATGMNFPDALAAGAVAGSRKNTVVVLTRDGSMPINTLNFLNAVPNKTVFGIGGSGVTALQSVNIPETGVAGGDRFITAAMVAHTFFGGPQMVGIATGYNFPDALAGGALAGAAGGPLLLTGPTLLPTETVNYLRTASGSVSDAVMFGGPAVLDDNLKVQVGELIGQSGKWGYAENDPNAHLGAVLASAY